MPYLVEMLRATAITAVYHPLEEMLEYSIQASILKGERSPTFPRVAASDVNTMLVCDDCRRSQ